MPPIRLPQQAPPVSGFPGNPHQEEDPGSARSWAESGIQDLDTASQNAETCLSLIQVSESILDKQLELLDHLHERMGQTSSGSLNGPNRRTVQFEIDAILKKIDRLAQEKGIQTLTTIHPPVTSRSLGLSGLMIHSRTHPQRNRDLLESAFALIHRVRDDLRSIRSQMVRDLATLTVVRENKIAADGSPRSAWAAREMAQAMGCGPGKRSAGS